MPTHAADKAKSKTIFSDRKNLLPKSGEAYYAPDFLGETRASELMASLLIETEWQSGHITLFGKKVLQPRLFAWFGDKGCSYTYSGLTLDPETWSATLLQLKKLTESACLSRFNCALLNLYRDENDSMGTHSDDEKELGGQPVIASVSLGASRRFHLQHKYDKAAKVKLQLDHGSLLLMRGETQKHWKHSVPKERTETAPRINITFRTIFIR